jgi:thioredoxin-dependent peroxiredoxin
MKLRWPNQSRGQRGNFDALTCWGIEIPIASMDSAYQCLAPRARAEYHSGSQPVRALSEASNASLRGRPCLCSGRTADSSMARHAGSKRRFNRSGFCLGSLSLLVLVGCWAARRPDGGTGLLPVASPAPDLAGKTRQGEVIRLSSVRGHPAVVYFYPRDETPGCTREACAFRDAFAEYSSRQVTIFGVSQDSEQSHRDFSEHRELPFPLVADDDGAVTLAYGVSSAFGMTSRVTFLIDAEGRVAHVWPDVDPGVHAREVLSAIDALGK